MDLIRESTAFSGGSVDAGGVYPVIRGVLLCGRASEHGYTYEPSVWTNEALAKYENAPAYEGHGEGIRRPSDKIGWWSNVRKRADGQPIADLNLEPSHPLAPRLIRAAQPGGNPKLYAMSHVAHVTFGNRSGRKVVESIGQVFSVDVVSRGGTTGGIFESGRAPGGDSSDLIAYLDRLIAQKSAQQRARSYAAAHQGVPVKEDGAVKSGRGARVSEAALRARRLAAEIQGVKLVSEAGLPGRDDDDDEEDGEDGASMRCKGCGIKGLLPGTDENGEEFACPRCGCVVGAEPSTVPPEEQAAMQRQHERNEAEYRRHLERQAVLRRAKLYAAQNQQ